MGLRPRGWVSALTNGRPGYAWHFTQSRISATWRLSIATSSRPRGDRSWGRQPWAALVAVSLLACTVLASGCGDSARQSGPANTVGATTRSVISTGPRVSTNPYARQVDQQCAQAMPAIVKLLADAAEVRAGTQATFNLPLFREAAQNAKALDSSSQQVIAQVATAGAADRIDEPAPWHASFDGLAGALGTMYQGVASPGFDSTYPAVAAEVVQLGQSVNTAATTNELPDCRADPALGGAQVASGPTTATSTPTTPSTGTEPTGTTTVPETTTASTGSSGKIAPCSSVTVDGALWRTYVTGSASCGSATAVLNTVLRHGGTLHEGADDAHTYTDDDGWRCPLGHMGGQSCSLPMTAPHRAAALALDCADTPDGGCPAQIPDPLSPVASS